MARLRLPMMSGLVASLLAFPAIGLAQTSDQASETPPAHVSYTDGRVVLEYDANSEEIEANTPLVPGDRVRTEGGRAEIVFGDGSVVHVDDRTTLDLLSDRLVRLLAGRLVVTVGTGLAGQLQVDAPAASVRALSAGEYRISLLSHGGGADLELAVVRGRAELFTERDVVALAAGQRAVAEVSGAFAGPWPFNSADLDAFGAWSQARLEARRGPTSYAYVPGEVRHYAGDFDRYGTWGHEPAYGYVWYPRVAHGWRPYYHGRWKHYPRWGWTWVGGPRWSWPTHHYGRWGVSSAGAWFWIPGRRWSGAWVHWGVASGYVSWCPLGFDNRPVFAFWRHGHRYRHNPWRGWTMVHRSHFGARRGVHVVALDGHRVVTTQRSTFVTQATPPFAGRRHGRLTAAGGGTPLLAVPRGGPASSRRVHPAAAQRSGRTASAPGPTSTIRSRSAGDIRAGSGTRYAVPRGQSSVAGSDTRGRVTQPVQGRRRGSAVGAARSPAAASPATQPDTSAFRRRSGRAVSRDATPWRAEDVPVYRGGAVTGEAPPTRARSRSGAVSPSSPAAPSSRVGGRAAPDAPRDRGGRGGAIAVPRGGGRGAAGPGYSAPSSRGGGAPARGSIGVPSGRSAAPSDSPASVGSGGRTRQATGGSSRGTAVSRGSGGGGGESSGGRGSRGGGRSRR